MPIRKKGSELDAMERATVLAAHPYRWTVENQNATAEFYAGVGGPPDTDPETDAQWLANRAFTFRADGRLVKGKKAVEWIGDSRIGGTTRRAGDPQ